LIATEETLVEGVLKHFNPSLTCRCILGLVTRRVSGWGGGSVPGFNQDFCLVVRAR